MLNTWEPVLHFGKFLHVHHLLPNLWRVRDTRFNTLKLQLVLSNSAGNPFKHL